MTKTIIKKKVSPLRFVMIAINLLIFIGLAYDSFMMESGKLNYNPTYPLLATLFFFGLCYQIYKLWDDLKGDRQPSRQEQSLSEVKQCPTCNSKDVYKAYIEDGSYGDWCPRCKMSIQKMKEK